MDTLKLAQFQNVSNSSNDLGCQFLKRYCHDLNYSISANSNNSNISGYNCLHFAAKNFDLTSINELINQKVDIVKQGDRDGKTALHIVSNSFFIGSQIFWKFHVLNYNGKLKKHKFVDTLLSAQVQSGITLNPKTIDGMSHLHIACMYNHAKAIEHFLRAGESVNHVTNQDHELPGYTALHFAVRYSSFEAAQILLNNGADVHLKDCKGKSALHFLIERLMDVADFLAVGKRTFCPFYEQERDTLEAIVEEIVKSRQIDGLDDSGLTSLHLGCVLKDSALAENCFTTNMDVTVAIKNDDELWPGWTPLHFAACFSIETFKLLLHHQANLNAKNAKGYTPLDLCMQRYSPYIVHSILSTKDKFKNILFSDGFTNLLDVLLMMTNDKIFKNWLNYLEDVDISIPLNSPIWPGNNLLHLAILNEKMNLKDVKMTFAAGLSIFSKPSSDCVLSECWNEIMECLLSKPFNFNTKNADGLSPCNLAFKLHRINSVEMILSSRRVNREICDGLYYSHMACATGNTRLLERFLNNTDMRSNEPTGCNFEWYIKDSYTEIVHVPANSTLLHIAVIFKNVDVVEYLLGIHANIYTKDQRGLNPIQLSLINGNFLTRYLITSKFLQKILNHRESVRQDNPHCLHIAALCDNNVAIEKLLKNGVNNLEIRFEPSNLEMKKKFKNDIGKTPLHLALSYGCFGVASALINAGADILASASECSEKLLTLAIKNGFVHREEYVSQLRLKKFCDVDSIDETGVTMLHIACANLDVAWMKNLLRNGADPNACITREVNCNTFSNGSTPLGTLAHIVCTLEIDEKDRVNELIEMLIAYGADVTIMNAQGLTPLHVLFYDINDESDYNDLSIHDCSGLRLFTITLLLRFQKIYNSNPLDPSGLSHFHLACIGENLNKIVEKFLEASVDVNQVFDPFAKVEAHAGYTPLHFAIEKNNVYVARMLIEHGANVTIEDIRGNTPVHVALKNGFVDADLIGLMISHGADINAENVEGITPIEYLFKREAFTLQQLNIMLDHGAVIDLAKLKPSGAGTIGLAMKNAESNDRHSIIQKVIDASNMEDAINKGFNVIESAVNIHRMDALTVENYLDVIEGLVDAGCDLNKEDQKGKTALHQATYLYNDEAVKALLLVGANLNAVDRNGEPPLTKEVIKNYKLSQSGRRTLDTLAIEMWKMMNMGLSAHKGTITAYSQVIERIISVDNTLTYNSVQINCLEELNVIRQTFINQIPLIRFLSESEAVIWYSKMPMAERKTIDEFFKCVSDLRKKFPQWSGFLMMQYRKAVARAKMIKPAMNVIYSTGIKLPALCLELVVEYLNYDEVKILVREP